MDESKHKLGFWFRFLLFFDLFSYATEWLQRLVVPPLIYFYGWCLSVLHSSRFPMTDRRYKKLWHERKESRRYCLHSQRISFFDTFSIVNAIPTYILASDDVESASKDPKKTSDVEASNYETTHSKLSRPSLKHEIAFHGKALEPVQACVFSKDGSHFAICYVSGKVALWNTDHGTLLQEGLLESSSVCSISFLGDENSALLICARDYTCWKWEIDVDGSRVTKIFDKEMVSSIGEQIFSQRSDFYNDGTKLVLSTITNSEDGSTLDVVLVDITSSPFRLDASPLPPVNVERDFVISNAILSPDGNGLLVSLMDQAFEDSYCLLWPDLSEHRGYYKRLSKGTIGSWSSDSRYVVTWVMTNQMNSNNKHENSAFIWNVEEMREGSKNSEHLFKDEKIANPFGGNVFWCQVTQDVDNKDRLIMGVIEKTTRFLFIDMTSKMHTHTIEMGISAKDMILWNGEAWTQSYVAQSTVKGLSPMSVTKDGSMFGAVLGWPMEIIIWDAYLGVEILKVSTTSMQANFFKGGIDLMASPSCTKFAIVESNEVVVFCPSVPSKNQKRSKNCLESQMVQMDNLHASHDNSSTFKISFSGDGDSLGVLCIGLPKMQVWNLPQGTSCIIYCAQIEEGGNIQDFCLSNNGQYLVINIGKYIQIMDCKAKDVAQMVGLFNVDSRVVSMGINEDASELVICMEDGSIWCYERSHEGVHDNDETASPISSIHELAGHRLSLPERIKSWFKRPSVGVRESLIDNKEEDDQSDVEHTSVHIPFGASLPTYTRHVLAEEVDDATFQVSPTFDEVLRLSEILGVEAWDLKTKTRLIGPFNDISFIERKAHAYSNVSSISEQVSKELESKKHEVLNGTSIDLSRKTTLLQSSRENIIVAGNSSLQALSQRRDKVTFDIEYNEETQEESHSVYVINLNDAEYRRRLSGRNLKPNKGILIKTLPSRPTSFRLGLAISHDGRHVACFAGDFGSKVVVWNVYASEHMLLDYNSLSRIFEQDIACKEGIKRVVRPLIQEFGINFFNFRHPSGMSILEEAIYYFNNDLLKAILQYVSRNKAKISFLTRETSKDPTPRSECHNMIEASIIGRSPKTLSVLLEYLLRRVTHEAEVVKILTDSLVQILYHYKAIFIRLIRDPRLLSHGQEIKVRLENSNHF